MFRENYNVIVYGIVYLPKEFAVQAYFRVLAYSEYCRPMISAFCSLHITQKLSKFRVILHVYGMQILNFSSFANNKASLKLIRLLKL